MQGGSRSKHRIRSLMQQRMHHHPQHHAILRVPYGAAENHGVTRAPLLTMNGASVPGTWISDQ